MVDDFVPQDENLRLAELRFKASHGDTEAAATLKKDLVDRKALPFYQMVATELVGLTALLRPLAAFFWFRLGRKSSG